ncbi:MAG: LssY C-terminal domain-containing protein [Acidobacteriota bacterium]
MSRLTRFVSRLLSVPYEPAGEERAYLARAQTQEASGVEVTVSALSDGESHSFFGVRMARRGMQPLWIDIRNGSGRAYRLQPLSLDPNYYPPLEAAYVNHFAMLKRVLRLGLLAWVFVPVLPLVPIKLYGARRANQRMDAFFKEHGYRVGPITANGTRSGFIFATLREGMREVQLELRSADDVLNFGFSLEVPGLLVNSAVEDPSQREQLTEVDAGTLRRELEKQPRATTNKRGNKEGDPLNLVVVGSLALIRACFGARWDLAESVTLSTSLKMARAFLLDSAYLYAPVSPLFVAGRQQQLALQKARATINERLHMRLWRTSLSFGGEQVWIGQVSRDIGVRMTPKTWNLTTHKIDPDVDEARDYVVDDLMASGRVSQAGFVAGAGAATPAAPRRNLTGDPYFTDGQRAVLVLAHSTTRPTFFSPDPSE